MSGGHFNFSEYAISDIYNEIQRVIDEEDGYNFNSETISEFQKGIRLLKEARVYARRIDYLLSGDDGEDTFHQRLEDDLGKLQQELHS